MQLMRMLASILALLPLPALAVQAPPVVRCETAPVPPGSSLSLVASQIAINGLPMAIVAVHSKLSPPEFLKFYANAWTAADGHPVYIRYPLGPWQVIAHAEGGCFYTVQVQAAGSGSGALIGVSMPKRGSNNAMVPDVVAPSDARVLTHMVSEDGGKQGDTWLLYTATPTAVVMHFYARVLRQRGWAQIMQHLQPGKPDVATAMYQKGAANIGLVVQPMRTGSAITITEMTH